MKFRHCQKTDTALAYTEISHLEMLGGEAIYLRSNIEKEAGDISNLGNYKSRYRFRAIWTRGATYDDASNINGTG